MPDMNFCPWCGNRLGTRMLEGRSYRACVTGSCGYVYWDNPLPVVAAIVEHDGAVIIARGRGWPDKMFGIITGFLERGETPEEAVLREVREELGLSGELKGFVGIYPFFQANQLLLVYHVAGTGEIVLNDELAEIKHVSPEKLRPWPLGTGPAVKDWLERRYGIK
ncbi:MAG TPA: NUDIX domain-containing protein [Spirochaetota bacterium]|nr:NUDIX domain-containing protein [Spirochaetota bacterium]HOD14286.1 NUDIX domain-containing protein [Spirochaetota bacterium]HPG49266.1 NUDIX domain-containing protein [Spirochaetota bacterium]HPN11073.1 NUDIX domain-containing protein [Spirochaetota bacterium]HQL81719.1 NUDIX domain-containing protein [Spirochaetota bacterium]